MIVQIVKYILSRWLWGLLYVDMSEILSEEKQLREGSEDRTLPERSVEEWLLRREKKQTALSTRGYARSFLCMTLSHTG